MYTYSDVEAIQPDTVIVRFTWLVICRQGTALLHRRAGFHVRRRRFDYEVVQSNGGVCWTSGGVRHELLDMFSTSSGSTPRLVVVVGRLVVRVRARTGGKSSKRAGFGAIP